MNSEDSHRMIPLTSNILSVLYASNSNLDNAVASISRICDYRFEEQVTFQLPMASDFNRRDVGFRFLRSG